MSAKGPWDNRDRCELDPLLIEAIWLFPRIGGALPCDGCDHDRADCGGLPRRTPWRKP